MNFTEIKDIISAACKKHGVEEYEIFYTVGEDISAETLKDEVSAFSSGESAKVYFRCLVDGHMGLSSSSYFNADEFEDLVLRAKDNASVIENNDVVVIFKGSESYAKPPLPSPRSLMQVSLRIKHLSFRRQPMQPIAQLLTVHSLLLCPSETRSISITLTDLSFPIRLECRDATLWQL